MNLVIISGGTGNDSLVRGLKELYPSINVKVIVNAYDAGKSTGICRKVTDTLGVSDIRKNHIRMYLANTETPNKSIVEFYNRRYNFSKGNEVKEILELLDKWGLNMFSVYIHSFFNREKSKKYKYNDFNVSNIVYAEMYSQKGYVATNSFFCDFLGIDDFLVLNSFDNVYINAITESGETIEDEGDIVEYCNDSDIIESLEYEGDCYHQLNYEAIRTINKADFILISSGTFWSSIYPTLDYGGFYHHINMSKAKKMWIMNNECDKDSYGVGSNQFINIVKNMGLNLDDFTVLLNSDANPLLQQNNSEVKTITRPMGNIEGKHDSTKCAKEVLKYYYGLQDVEYEKIFFDFDDTLWSRRSRSIAKEELISINNILDVHRNLSDKAVIISGNSYKSIRDKLAKVFGTDSYEFNIPIWADANSVCYHFDKKVDKIDEFLLDDNLMLRLGAYLFDKYGLVVSFDSQMPGEYSYLKIKPILESLVRSILVNYLNDYLLNHLGCNDAKAVATGKTTIDILHKENNKSKIVERMQIPRTTPTLYVGDECNEGNDKAIASMCTTYINTKDVEETACILRLLK